MFNQFIREKDHLNVTFVTTAAPKKVICNHMLSKLKRHVESVHEENKSYKCVICDYSCSQKDYLKRHFESVHEGKKPFKCEICKYSCSKKSTMKMHTKSIHEKKKL